MGSGSDFDHGAGSGAAAGGDSDDDSDDAFHGLFDETDEDRFSTLPGGVLPI